MIYKVSSLDVNNLVNLPESGMGYQIVSASKFRETQSQKFVIYNSALAISLDSAFNINKKKIITEGFMSLFNKSPELLLETSTITILEKSALSSLELRSFKTLSESTARDKKRISGGKGAKDKPPRNANGTEQFVRLSAYGNDKRIDFEKKKLKPGSYTTTKEDYLICIETNDDPIDRYALPNNDPIKWAFHIQPKKVDSLQEGIAQPAFDHQGGGIEAFFEHGTSEGTFLTQTWYGTE